MPSGPCCRDRERRPIAKGTGQSVFDDHARRTTCPLGSELASWGRLRDRVYGPELTLRVCRAAAEQGVPVYLYGGSPEDTRALQKRLCDQLPDLRIAGSESPPFRDLTEEENQAACERINRSGAKILLIGLGCPKQDYFAAKNADRVQAVQMCVGAAFDFHAGAKPMAPAWMQRNGLEWLFRLWCEPQRLWKRYLVTNTIFCAKLAASAPKAIWGRFGPH